MARRSPDRDGSGGLSTATDATPFLPERLSMRSLREAAAGTAKLDES